MVQTKITKKLIKEICYGFEFYDNYKTLPNKKKRINITLSAKSLSMIKDANRSKYIENLIKQDYSRGK